MKAFAVLSVVLLLPSLIQGDGEDSVNIAHLRNRLAVHKSDIALSTTQTLASPQKIIGKTAIEEDVQHDSRIVGGSEVKAHSVPHQAALLTSIGTFCGGSLISDVWILTAATCVTPLPNFVDVVLGAHDISNDESTQQTIRSNKIIVHPNWNRLTGQNDVALIRLSYSATLNANVSPACLVASNITIQDGTKMTVTGWGFTKDTDNGLTPRLRSVDVTTISNQECGQSYYNSIIDNGMMCTSSDNGKKGICKGDGGSPLTITGRSVDGSPNKRQCQAGIASFISGAGCQSGMPSGFTRVSYFIDDFITKETGIKPCHECSSGSSISNSLSFFWLIGSMLALRFSWF